MALNATGAISLGGSTTGQSIALELGLSATAQISLNCATVRTLGAVPTGAIIMPTNFYGKSATVATNALFSVQHSTTCVSNLSVNACGTKVAGVITTTNVSFQGAGSINSQFGAKTGPYGLFVHGVLASCVNSGNQQIYTINKCRGLVGRGSVAAAARFRGAGAPITCTNMIAYGGFTTVATNQVYRYNCARTVVGSVTTAGTARYWLMGAKAGCNGIFYGGGTATSSVNTVTRINACGALVGTQGTVTPTKRNGAGITGGTNAMYGMGYVTTTPTNQIVRINACGALVGSVTTVGTARYGVGGARACATNIFYGGTVTLCCLRRDYATRVNDCGAIVGAETTNVAAASCCGAGWPLAGGSPNSNLITQTTGAGGI
jgi:hypothetical protein